MSNHSEYTVMGDDGKEYGPVSAEQIRAWISEGRLERKTPVKAAAAKDWVFLEMLPEFAHALKAAAAPPPAAPRSRKGLVVAVVIGLAILAFLVLKKINQP